MAATAWLRAKAADMGQNRAQLTLAIYRDATAVIATTALSALSSISVHRDITSAF
jgi:hypothetical protein